LSRQKSISSTDLRELLSNQQTQGRGTIPQEIEQSDNSDVEDDDESSFD